MYDEAKFYNAHKEGNECFGFLYKLMKLYVTSIYKFLLKYFFIYLVVAYICQSIYLFVLDVSQRETLRGIRDLVVIVSLDDRVMVPVLGVYMARITGRIAATSRLVRFPDELLVVVTSMIPGFTVLRRSVKSTIVRYVLASYILALNKISYAVQNKFPDLPTMVNAGILTTYEAGILEDCEADELDYSKPLDWAGKLVSRGRSDSLMSQEAAEMLMKGLAAQTATLSQLLAYAAVGGSPYYSTALFILVLLYSLFEFSLRVFPEKIDISQPVTFLLNPLSSAILFACYHATLKVANIINDPLKLEHDFLGLNQFIDDRIESVIHCYRKIMVEKKHLKRDEWYENALAHEMTTEDEPLETQSATEEQIDELYERTAPQSSGVTAEQNVASNNTVSTPVSGEGQKRDTVLTHTPDVTPSVSVQLAQELTRSGQKSLELGLKQHQEELRKIEENLHQLRNSNQTSNGLQTGTAFGPQDVEDHYVDIEAVLRAQKQVPKTNPARRCETCCKFYLTEEELRDLEQKTNGFDDIRKYKKLQCKCVKAVWV